MVTFVENPLATQVTTTDYSLTVGITAVTVFANGALLGKALCFMRIWNASATATIWLSRSGNAAAANTAGSFSLGPGQYEVWASPQPVPVNPVSIVATSANTPVTIEVG